MRFRNRLNQLNVMESKIVVPSGGMTSTRAGHKEPSGMMGMVYLGGGYKCAHRHVLKT